MPPKGKTKKGNGTAKSITLKSRSRQLARKSQPLPTYTPTTGEDTSELNRTLANPVDTENSLKSVMDMLVDITSRLRAIVHFMHGVRANKAMVSSLTSNKGQQSQSRAKKTSNRS